MLDQKEFKKRLQRLISHINDHEKDGNILAIIAVKTGKDKERIVVDCITLVEDWRSIEVIKVLDKQGSRILEQE